MAKQNKTKTKMKSIKIAYESSFSRKKTSFSFLPIQTDGVATEVSHVSLEMCIQVGNIYI